MECTSKFIRYILYFFNLLIVIVGLSLIIVGIIYLVNLTNVTEKITEDFTISSILIIVIGLIVFAIAFFGFWGAYKSSRLFLLTYSIILLTLLVIQIAVGIYAFIEISNGNIRSSIKSEFRNSMKLYESSGDSMQKTFVDTVQSNLTCCGTDGPSDWGDLKLKYIPNSCCEDWNEVCNMDNCYRKGCAQELYDFITNSVLEIACIVTGLCFIELVPAVLALYLRHLLFY